MLPFLRKLLGLKTQSKADLPTELIHINQEMYKKSFELSERNKTLLLLRKIDEIILSSVTDHNEIARRVTRILVTETDFQIATIFRYDQAESILKRLALYETSSIFESNIKNATEKYYIKNLHINDVDNIIVQSVRDKTPTSSKTIKNSLFTNDGSAHADNMQNATGIKSFFVYPFIVRNEVTGVIVIALRDEEQDMSEYTQDLLVRLSQVIGIAIDNASLYNELQGANEKLKALDKLKDEFVYLASHELRTPMTAVKSYLWMTLQGDAGVLNDTQKLYLNRAYSSVERLIKLVNDMLNISRIESGRVTVELQKVNIYKLAQDVVAEVLPRANELGVHVLVSPAAQLPDVLADSDKIKEVLFNLIGNSLKFTPKDGNVKISFYQKDETVEIEVSDSGAGISPDNISKLFQKFSMLPDSYANNKNATGTGLGLYISQSIVELHKGKIWATSEGLGKGSKFYISLKIFNEIDYKESNYFLDSSKKETVGIVHTQL